MALVLRRLPLFLAVAAATVVLVLLVAMQATPQYRSTASLIVDPRQQDVSNVQVTAQGGPTDTNLVDTYVQLLGSRAIASEVVGRLGLTHDPEFSSVEKPKRGLVDSLLHPNAPAPVTDPSVGSAASARERAIDAVMTRALVRRSGLTYVINVTVTSPDAAKAARIANAYVEAFISQQVVSKNGVIRNAGGALDERLTQLAAEVQTADAEVQRYKIANNLMSADGTTMAEQEVSALNQQIAVSKAELSEKEARLAAARSQISRGGGGADVGAALGSDTIRSLRQQEAEASRKVAELSTRYGDKHPEVQKAQGQLQDAHTQIQLEINRIISSLEAEVQVARQRLGSLQGSQGHARGSLAANNSAQVGLMELQRRADANRAIYEAFLGRSKQTAAQEGAVLADARVVSRAQIPTAPSSPNLRLALLFGLSGGIVLGAMAVAVVELFKNGVETGSQVESKFGLPYAGSVPTVGSTLEKMSKRSKSSPHNYLVENPFSAFAEALRSVKTFVTLSNGDHPAPQVIVITSALPREGKSMTSVCLARSIAMSGSSVVLVDCDLRRRGSSALFDAAPHGLVDVLEGKVPLRDALVKDDRTDAWILPVRSGPNSIRDLFATQNMDQVLQSLRASFDYVLLDTAPVLAVAETRLLAAKADGVLMLTQWRKTPFRAADDAAEMLLESGARIIGVALTRVDLRQQSRFGYGDRYYYYKAYRSYYAS
jgi:exopolysaccharide transport family protein